MIIVSKSRPHATARRRLDYRCSTSGKKAALNAGKRRRGSDAEAARSLAVLAGARFPALLRRGFQPVTAAL
ncbi:hypothetical protein ACS3UN_10975 [Oscillospiraceae bacterium LTW-04]|nr:hypothetical protein RBH76_12720 [Oscillospiraceae bacterium MB24-C1]